MPLTQSSMLIATLIISQPGLATQEVESGESVMSIGSALDNIICLEDEAGVARYHAVIERHDDGFRLNELGTRQGTKVNGEPIFYERELTDGDRIMLGHNVVIEFYSHEAATPRAAPGVSSSRSSSSTPPIWTTQSARRQVPASPPLRRTSPVPSRGLPVPRMPLLLRRWPPRPAP